MRYLVIGSVTMAGIVLASLVAVDWALHGAMALAWTAFACGILGVLALIACLWLYVRMGRGDARQEHPETAFSPAHGPHDRAQERAWMRGPPLVADVRPASTTGPRRREAHRSKRSVAR